MESSRTNVITDVRHDDCCGCGACVNICPKSALAYSCDVNGFIYPVIDNTLCVNCGKCLKVCPAFINTKKIYRKAYAAVAADKNVRLRSSSGGIFSVISGYILQQGGVVYGCIMDEHFKVKHIRVDDDNQLPLLRRSKYVQSDMSSTYKMILSDLKNGKAVLFVGTPCQVSAVNNYTSNHPLLLTIDIVCHGVPSQKIFDDYLSFLQSKEGEIESFEFRTKRIVNNGMNWFFSYKLKEKQRKTIKNWPQDVFTYLYMMSYINRESCYHCQYTTKDRVGDFTLCDYWKWEKYHFAFDKNSTVSGIICNSQKAEDILKNVIDELQIEETDYNNIIKHNSCLENPVDIPDNRDEVLNTIRKNGFSLIDREYRRRHKKNIIKNNLRMLLPQRLVNILSDL